MATNNAINLVGPNPAFSAYLNTSVANAAGGISWYNPICDQVWLNNASCYDAVTGIFTPPITGTYVLGVTASFSGFTGGATYMFMQLYNSITSESYTLDNQQTSNATTSYSNRLELQGLVMANFTAAQPIQIYILADGTQTITSLGLDTNQPHPTRFYGYYVPTY